MFNWTGQFLRPTERCLSTRSTSWTQEHSTSECKEWCWTTSSSAPSDNLQGQLTGPLTGTATCSFEHSAVSQSLLLVSALEGVCGILNIAKCVSQWVTDLCQEALSWAQDSRSGLLTSLGCGGGWDLKMQFPSESDYQCEGSCALAGGACFCCGSAHLAHNSCRGQGAGLTALV